MPVGFGRNVVPNSRKSAQLMSESSIYSNVWEQIHFSESIETVVFEGKELIGGEFEKEIRIHYETI